MFASVGYKVGGFCEGVRGVRSVASSRIKDTGALRVVICLRRGGEILVGFGQFLFFAQHLLPLLYYTTVVQPNPKTYYGLLLRSMFFEQPHPPIFGIHYSHGVCMFYMLRKHSLHNPHTLPVLHFDSRIS